MFTELRSALVTRISLSLERDVGTRHRVFGGWMYLPASRKLSLTITQNSKRGICLETTVLQHRFGQICPESRLGVIVTLLPAGLAMRTTWI